ncbi:hypothetical protein BJX61DRAFT_347842 [Aspergillus egyptiacus]|nr:hypothetical protein BJX61DRAFT_347842 [Aspergillus egyptiacus]
MDPLNHYNTYVLVSLLSCCSPITLARPPGMFVVFSSYLFPFAPIYEGSCILWSGPKSGGQGCAASYFVSPPSHFPHLRRSRQKQKNKKESSFPEQEWSIATHHQAARRSATVNRVVEAISVESRCLGGAAMTHVGLISLIWMALVLMISHPPYLLLGASFAAPDCGAARIRSTLSAPRGKQSDPSSRSVIRLFR